MPPGTLTLCRCGAIILPNGVNLMAAELGISQPTPLPWDAGVVENDAVVHRVAHCVVCNRERSPMETPMDPTPTPTRTPTPIGGATPVPHRTMSFHKWWTSHQEVAITLVPSFLALVEVACHNAWDAAKAEDRTRLERLLMTHEVDQLVEILEEWDAAQE